MYMPKTFGNIKYRQRTRRNKRMTHRRRYLGGNITNTSIQDTSSINLTKDPQLDSSESKINSDSTQDADIKSVSPESEIQSKSLESEIQSNSPESEIKSELTEPETKITVNKNDITDQISLIDNQVEKIIDTSEVETMLGTHEEGSDKYIDKYQVERTYNPNTDIVYKIKNWVEIPEETIKFTSDELKANAEKVVTSIKEYLEELSKMIGKQNKYIKVSYGGIGDDFIHVVHTNNPIFVLKKSE